MEGEKEKQKQKKKHRRNGKKQKKNRKRNRKRKRNLKASTGKEAGKKKKKTKKNKKKQKKTKKNKKKRLRIFILNILGHPGSPDSFFFLSIFFGHLTQKNQTFFFFSLLQNTNPPLSFSTSPQKRAKIIKRELVRG